MTKGIFIAMEGMDCSGKSSSIAYLTELFEKRGYAVITTREPGGTNMAEEIRGTLLKERKEKVLPLTEVLLFAAARHQHVETVIKPSLAEGYVVISDRFTDSSFAYQACGRGMMQEFLTAERLAIGSFRPDHVLHFNVSLETAMARQRLRTGKNDRLDQESIEFKKVVREGYIARSNIEFETYVNIDAEQSIEDVKECLNTWVKNRFPDLSCSEEGKANWMRRWNSIFGTKILDTTTKPEPVEGNPFRSVILHEFPEGTSEEEAKALFAEVFVPLRYRSATGIRCEVGQPIRKLGESAEDYLKRVMAINENNVCMSLMEVYMSMTEYGDNRIRIYAKVQLCGPYGKYAKDYLETLTDTARPMAYRSIRAGNSKYSETEIKKQGRSSPLNYHNLQALITWDLCNLPPFDDEGRPNYKVKTCIPSQ